LHVGFVITSLVGGGAEKVVLTLASEMVRQGHEVDVYVLTGRSNYHAELGVNVNFLSHVNKVPSLCRGLFYKRTARKFLARVRERESVCGKHDLIFYNLPEDYVLGDMAQLDNSYYCLHTSILMSLNDQMRRSKSRYKSLKKRYEMLDGKNVIAVSRGVADEVRQLEWLKVSSVETIYNPFDIEVIRKLSNEKLKYGIDYKYLIHVGRAARLKRHDLLFKAFKRLPLDYRLVLLSKDTDKLRGLAKNHGVEDRVILPGFQDNPYNWIRKAELSVLCSDFEGLGNVIIESLICGTPVVSTDCPYGPAEILSGNLSGNLCPVDDSDALADKMLQVIDSKMKIDKPAILDEVDISYVVNQYFSLAAHD